uniref:C2 NT-type domain-containing protein n=1 Tax=Davidia involucrata TaxID=16924 RepID=A0A5B6ZE64_DAVIN
MVVKMMKWRPLSSKKSEAKIVVRHLKGLCISQGVVEKRPEAFDDFARLSVEIKWKGSKGNALSSFRRSVKRNFTKEESLREDGVIEWNEEFRSVCSFSAYKEGVFHPWEVAFTVFNGLNDGPKNKLPVIATASLNLSEFASAAEEKELEINIPLIVSGCSIECSPSLCLAISLLELRTAQKPSDIVQRSVTSVQLSPRSGQALSTEKDEHSALKAGLRKVKIFTGYVSAQRAKKACREEDGSDGRSSVKSEDVEYNYPVDTDSLDDLDEGESEEGKEDSSVRKSFSYGTLAFANYAGSFYSNTSNSEDEDWIYYSNQRSDAGCLHVEDSTVSVRNQSLPQSSKRSILPWRKRKLSFRSPKAKGEPLLKKDYGEEGGDDIDFDRRQLSSSDESTLGRCKGEEDSTTCRSSVSEFGDDSFAVGSWEKKEVISRDGNMKLQTEVFFASIDQRNEQAAGESACTALVAVIADWFQFNRDEMPIKSQLDSLIQEGSLEWRNLCENEAYRERFPDKHFDLETVLQAKIRPLCVVPERSFIGFFHPEGLEEEGVFDFLHCAMSFDNIWDEISHFGADNPTNGDPLVYIVSWNDHFFVLKVEQDAYYIIDTLGERLYEGCNQAYVLKFDKDTTIRRLPNEKPACEKVQPGNSKETSEGTEIIISNEPGNSEGEELVVCRGKESCKEYIKSFLAAIPIRELQVDLKKGLMASTPLHHRLQIEFHYTQFLQPVAQFSSVETTADAPVISALAVV